VRAKMISLTQWLARSASQTVQDFLVLGRPHSKDQGPIGEWSIHSTSGGVLERWIFNYNDKNMLEIKCISAWS
jgi:hypothetical protein